jgi:hypothetical protein
LCVKQILALAWTLHWHDKLANKVDNYIGINDKISIGPVKLPFIFLIREAEFLLLYRCIFAQRHAAAVKAVTEVVQI